MKALSSPRSISQVLKQASLYAGATEIRNFVRPLILRGMLETRKTKCFDLMNAEVLYFSQINKDTALEWHASVRA